MAPDARQAPRWPLLLLPLLALLLWLFGAQDPAVAETPEPTPAPAAAADRATVPPPQDAAPHDAERTAEPEPSLLPDLAHPFAFALDLTVRDGFGLPVPDALVFVAAPACALSLWPAPTDARGHLPIRWQGRTSRMELTVAVVAWGVLQPLRRVACDADRPQALAVVATGRRLDPAAVAALQQQPDELARLQRAFQRERRQSGRLQRRDEFEVLCGREVLLFRGFFCVECHETSRLAGYASLGLAGTAGPSLHPHALLSDFRTAPPDEKQLRARQEQFQRSEQDEDRRRQGLLAVVPGGSELHGRVTDADGRPAAAVPIAWRDADGAVRHRTATNDHGEYRLAPIGRGMVSLSAGGGAGGALATSLLIGPGEHEWSPRLLRTDTVRGTAVDEQGRPFANWMVEFEGEGGATALGITNTDGAFLLANVGARGRCLLWPQGRDLRLPVAISDMVLPDGEAVRLRIDPDVPARARLRLRPVLPASSFERGQRPEVEVRVFQEDSGRGAHIARGQFEDQFQLEGLPAGNYRVEVGAPGLGWTVLGPVYVDGRGLWDLGAIALPVPGRARLVVPAGVPAPGSLPHALYRREPALDVLVDPRVEGDDWVLAPGRYVLLWQHPGQGLRGLEFGVEALRVTEMPVPAR